MKFSGETSRMSGATSTDSGRVPSHVTLGLSWCCLKVSLDSLSVSFSLCLGFRRNCRRTGSKWDFGRTHRHPLSRVASSSASHKPRQVCRGVVYKNVESWCEWTAPPTTGFLKMYIDWGTTGSRYPSDNTSSRSFEDVVYSKKGLCTLPRSSSSSPTPSLASVESAAARRRRRNDGGRCNPCPALQRASIFLQSSFVSSCWSRNSGFSFPVSESIAVGSAK
mmetsp:Transcript_8461/g.25043  ORF Transcript_8461/g.25043 Transcript_8461/m.25043 type:complete len:221 (+) Transcript_8461:3480-4142(+)